jgi:AbrB family looped-hinge helix DNA binding protein
MVSEGKGPVAELESAEDDLLDVRSAIEEGEIGMGMELSIIRRHGYQFVYTGCMKVVMEVEMGATIAKVMDKGLVVIPREIREGLGLKKGDRVQFMKWGGNVVMVPVSDDPVRTLRGILKSRGTMSDFLAEKRRELAEEEKDLPPPPTPNKR